MSFYTTAAVALLLVLAHTIKQNIFVFFVIKSQVLFTFPFSDPESTPE